jgi:hypothetical protein
MFTVLEVRKQLASYRDPGWYENPPGTLAEAAQNADLARDGIDVNAPPEGRAGRRRLRQRISASRPFSRRDGQAMP